MRRLSCNGSIDHSSKLNPLQKHKKQNWSKDRDKARRTKTWSGSRAGLLTPFYNWNRGHVRTKYIYLGWKWFCRGWKCFWRDENDFAVVKMILPWRKWFCRGQHDFAVVKMICRDEKDFAVTAVGHRSFVWSTNLVLAFLLIILGKTSAKMTLWKSFVPFFRLLIIWLNRPALKRSILIGSRERSELSYTRPLRSR